VESGATQSGSDIDFDVVLFVVCVLVIVGLMLFSYFYPYPSGRRPGLVAFFLFWLRECVLLALTFVGAVAVVLGRMLRWWKGRSESALDLGA
jgi:hypothetical protein